MLVFVLRAKEKREGEGESQKERDGVRNSRCSSRKKTHVYDSGSCPRRCAYLAGCGW